MEDVRSATTGLSESQVAALVAVFDLDRTLVPGSSTAAFARMLVRRRLVARKPLARHAMRAAWFARRGVSDATLARIGDAALGVVAGLPQLAVVEVAAEAAPVVAATAYPAARWLLDQHLQAGHFCVLLSAGPPLRVGDAAASSTRLGSAVGRRLDAV